MASNNLITLTAATHFNIKLTSHNFSVWRRHVQSTLIGLGLENYLTGSTPAPPATITDKDAGKDTVKPNPAFDAWFRQDHVIFSAILGSCSDEIQPLIASAKTAKDAWDRLSSSFASKSRSRIISLKSKLAKNPKGTRPIAEFLNEMRSIVDDLALVQSPITKEDLMVHILTQLGDEYTSIAAALKVRETPVSYPELFDKLVDFERSLKLTEPVTTMMATVNATQTRQTRTPGRPSSDSQHRNARFQPSNPSQRSFRPTKSQPGPSANRSAQFCNFCNIAGHDTRDCRKLARFLKENHISFNTNPVANAVTSAPGSPMWMMDSGASHHLSSCPATLSSVSEYGGPDEIVLGNGSQNGGAYPTGGEHP
ncbi:putative RNA-directed DNA polymerase [Helianthus debilis subsp. tardiflorus]